MIPGTPEANKDKKPSFKNIVWHEQISPSSLNQPGIFAQPHSAMKHRLMTAISHCHNDSQFRLIYLGLCQFTFCGCRITQKEERWTASPQCNGSFPTQPCQPQLPPGSAGASWRRCLSRGWGLPGWRWVLGCLASLAASRLHASKDLDWLVCF